MVLNKIITGNIGEDTLSIISIKNQFETETLNIKDLLKINGRIGPWDLTINKNGHLLILNAYDESLMTIDLATKNILCKIKLGRTPICIRLYNKKIYVLNCDSNSLSILDEDKLILVEEIYLDEKPSDLQIDIVEDKAYIANSNGNSISIINLIDNTIEVKHLDSQPFRLLLDDFTIYILSYINNGIINYSSISSIDKITNELKCFKIKGIYIDFVMIDKNTFLLTNPEDGYLYNFDIKEKKLTKRIKLGGMPNNIIWDMKNTLFITDLLNNQVLVIDLVEDSIINKIKVGKEPQGFILL